MEAMGVALPLATSRVSLLVVCPGAHPHELRRKGSVGGEPPLCCGDTWGLHRLHLPALLSSSTHWEGLPWTASGRGTCPCPCLCGKGQKWAQGQGRGAGVEGLPLSGRKMEQGLRRGSDTNPVSMTR